MGPSPICQNTGSSVELTYVTMNTLFQVHMAKSDLNAFVRISMVLYRGAKKYSCVFEISRLSAAR